MKEAKSLFAKARKYVPADAEGGEVISEETAADSSNIAAGK